jgi:ParB family transcriptional regulator, chromosome partitioning protein
MNASNNARPPQRRGLGRGLGSLIPTAPSADLPRDEVADTPGAEIPPFDVDPAQDGSHDGRAPSADAGAPESAPERAPEGAPGSVPEAAAGSVAGAYFVELPLGQITPNRVQPRQVFDEEAMAELVHSIREVGLLQPVVVRRTDDASYELVMGERRWRASQEAGLETIPAIVRGTDDNDMLRDALLENLHRAQLNPLEEASAYSQLLEDFDCTHEDLASRIGRSRPQISNTLRLLKLSPAVQRRVAAGVLSAGHARSLLAVDDPELQDRLAQRVVAEGISVRGLEEIVAVGDIGSNKPRVTRRRPTAPGLADLADRLSDRLETRVKVDLGKSRGRITVEFASLEDLQRIVDVMDPRNRDDRPI